MVLGAAVKQQQEKRIDLLKIFLEIATIYMNKHAVIGLKSTNTYIIAFMQEVIAYAQSSRITCP
jgi:hypothetical protein